MGAGHLRDPLGGDGVSRDGSQIGRSPRDPFGEPARVGDDRPCCAAGRHRDGADLSFADGRRNSVHPLRFRRRARRCGGQEPISKDPFHSRQSPDAEGRARVRSGAFGLQRRTGREILPVARHEKHGRARRPRRALRAGFRRFHRQHHLYLRHDGSAEGGAFDTRELFAQRDRLPRHAQNELERPAPVVLAALPRVRAHGRPLSDGVYRGDDRVRRKPGYRPAQHPGGAADVSARRAAFLRKNTCASARRREKGGAAPQRAFFLGARPRRGQEGRPAEGRAFDGIRGGRSRSAGVPEIQGSAGRPPPLLRHRRCADLTRDRGVFSRPRRHDL